MEKKVSKYHRYGFCQYCGKEIFKGNLKRHEAVCLKNPEIVKERKKKNLICEYCGKKYSKEESDSKRFCSKKCSRSFSSGHVNHNELKDAKCVICGADIKIKKNASPLTGKCDSCKIKKKYKGDKVKEIKKTCPFCKEDFYNCGFALHVKTCYKNPDRKPDKKNYKRKDIREGYIYKTTNKLNGKFYIGKKKGSPENSKSYLGSGIAIQQAISKYGKECFKKETLEYIPNGDLNEKEKYWIGKFGGFKNPLSYNLSAGGDGGPLFKGKKHTEETKRRLGEINSK